MSANTMVFLCGIYSLLFAVFHILFWKLFNWKKEVAHLHFTNGAILQILNLRLIYIFLLMAFICFYFNEELIATTLGRTLLGGFSLFWAGRTLEQFVFFDLRNKYVNLLTFIFLVGTLLFLLPIIY